jgi:hypothetical protein
MKILILFIIINILCISCGKKDSPVYQAQTEYNKNII